ncbi:hypothetical protein NPX13_g11368 [Xylaria arbuscula]|uniref:Capsule polysaccharide biosynthesis protein n=1 Tax=Xylaria arbuscula TaxID=114810 RepID=A0A9W8N2W5_9PEZI|nr:hypothetical protein NPX13_g11368 [Xylaria arbuscula]
MAEFTLPKSATGLREVPESRLDLRPEEEIVQELRSFRPVTSEKNVWCFWDKGLDRMYPSYRCTVLNWVRKLGSTWTIRIVDLVDDSPNNVYKYVSRDWFPECFLNRTMDGSSAAQHAADLVRLPLLYEYGGVWMDVGNMLHTHLDQLFWDALSAPDSPYEMAVWIITGQIRKEWGSFGNYMLAARKGCIFIQNWHNSYKELWRGRTNATGFYKLPLVQDIGIAEAMRDWGFGDKVYEMSDYVAQMLLGDRTKNLLDVSTGWDGREFWENKVFMVEGIRNGILGAILTEYDGYKQAELFTTALDEPDEEKRKAAEAFVVEVLENSHMYKVYHNSAGGLPALGDVIKKDGFKDADHRPGTFGELYRYGTVHWEPTREVDRLIPQPTGEELIRATPTTPLSDIF